VKLSAYSGHTPVDLDLDDFSLNQLGLLLDPHSDRSSEGLCKSFRLGHLDSQYTGATSLVITLDSLRARIPRIQSE